MEANPTEVELPQAMEFFLFLEKMLQKLENILKKQRAQKTQ